MSAVNVCKCIYIHAGTPFWLSYFIRIGSGTRGRRARRAQAHRRSSTHIHRTPVAHPPHNARVAQCMHQSFLRVQSSRQLIGGGRRGQQSAEALQWMRIMRICVPLHCAKVVRPSNGREATSEWRTLVTIQSDQHCKDTRPNNCKALPCSCARNATGIRRSAKRLSAWRQHAATRASCDANISTRRLCGNSLLSINSLLAAEAVLPVSFPFLSSFFFILA